MTPAQKRANEKYRQSEKGKAAISRAQKKAYQKSKEKWRERHLMKTYGIDLADYNELLLAQGSSCAICETHQDEFDKPLCVDHDHDTGAVRGLLCIKCNTALGTFGDNIEGLMKAVNYLRKD